MTPEDCKHPRLIKLINIEYGGEDSTTYQCVVCNSMLKVQLSPFTLKVIDKTTK